MSQEMNWQDYFRDFNPQPPASDVAISAFEQSRVSQLPADYVSFLRFANGGDGFLRNDDYIILWRVEDLQELNEAYEANDLAPGYLLFGSNGGGEAFAFDTSTPSWTVVRLPFVGMALEEARFLGSSFSEFIASVSTHD